MACAGVWQRYVNGVDSADVARAKDANASVLVTLWRHIELFATRLAGGNRRETLHGDV